MKKLLLFLLILTACQSTPDEETLRLNLADDPVSFVPYEVRTLRDLTLAKQLYEGLMRLDVDGVPQPAIAKTVNLSKDLCTYTFTLREAQWSDGSPVVANDFVQAWSEARHHEYAHMLAPIVDAQAIDAQTLVVTLDQPTPYFLELTAFPTYFPYKKEGVYNGPFVLEEWRPTAELTLAKNGTYWDAEHVPLQGITFTIITDNNTEHALFEKEALDWLGQPISHNIATELLHNTEADSYDVAGTFWFVFNTRKAPFDNPLLRQAFTYAIDREQIIAHILQGKQPAATSPLPPSMALSNKPHFVDGDIELARRLFDEAGGCEALTLRYPNAERTSKIVQLVQQQWESAFGIDVKLEALEKGLHRSEAKLGHFEVTTGQWIADFNDPLAFLELFTADSAMNPSGWTDAEFAALLTASRHEVERRHELLAEAEKILVEQMPIAPLYHYSFDYVKNQRVSGVVLSPLGTADFKTARTSHCSSAAL